MCGNFYMYSWLKKKTTKLNTKRDHKLHTSRANSFFSKCGKIKRVAAQ